MKQQRHEVIYLDYLRSGFCMLDIGFYEGRNALKTKIHFIQSGDELYH